MTCDSESSSGQQRGTPVKRKLSEQHGSQIQSSNQNIPSNQTKSQRSEAKRARKMEIETEFRILKSLIPNIANKQQINELEIIDACVNYIEALQDQLNIRSSTHCSSRPQQSVMSAMSAAAAAASAGCQQMGDMSDEVNSVGDDLEADDDYDFEDEENEPRTTSKWSSLASLDKEHEAGTSEEESSSSSDSESEGEEVAEENNNAASLSESAKKTEMSELKELTPDVAAAATLTSSEDKEEDGAASSKTSSIEDSTGNAEKPSS